MVEGSPVTCSNCKLKYLSRASGTCPRCDTADAAPAPPSRATFASSSAPAPAIHSAPAPSDRRPVAPLLWIGLSLVVLVGAGAAWSRWRAGDGPSADTPVAVDCYKIGGILQRGNESVKAIARASENRRPDIDLLMTWTDLAKEIDGIARELEAVSFLDPSLKEGAGEHAALLHSVAEQLRAAMVTARAGDGAQMEKVLNKLKRTIHETGDNLSRLSTRCKQR